VPGKSSEFPGDKRLKLCWAPRTLNRQVREFQMEQREAPSQSGHKKGKWAGTICTVWGRLGSGDGVPRKKK